AIELTRDAGRALAVEPLEVAPLQRQADMNAGAEQPSLTIKAVEFGLLGDNQQVPVGVVGGAPGTVEHAQAHAVLHLAVADTVPPAHAAGGKSLKGGCRIREEVAMNRRSSDGERDPAAGGTTQQRGQPLTITSRARLFDVGSCHDTLQSSLVGFPSD